MEQNIVASFMFHDTAKSLWQDLKITFLQEKNQSKLFDIYKKASSNLQVDRSLTDILAVSKVLLMN